jgi:DNA-binding transcriptional LysR family regulator
MNLKWFEDFLALAEKGNFSRAAQQRNMAQPAFSRRIRSLENWAGAPLFDRVSQPIQLTEAGQSLRPVAENVIRQVNQAKERVRQSVAGASTLKFFSTHTVSILFFPEWFHSIDGVPEQTGLNLQANHMTTCAKALIHGDCHFMLCLTNADIDLGFDKNEYNSKVIGKDFLIPISAAGDDGKPLYMLPGTPAKPIPHLVYSETSALGQIISAMLKRREEPVYLKRYSESPAADNLKSMAEKNHGIAWVVNMRAKRVRYGHPLVQAGDDSWRIPVDITIFRANGRLPAVAENFWELIEEC